MSIVLLVVGALFPVSEILLAVFKRARAGSAQVEDRGSVRLLWCAIAVGVGAAIACEWVPSARLAIPSRLYYGLVLGLILGGLSIRWISILTLGRFFTVNVAIHADHAVVETGIYRHIRHPSYAGLLLAFIGVGVSFANWASLLALLVPITLAVANRIRKEERALLLALGPAYAEYSARTRRLVPGLF
jgi:protein-S-isoprenylcysteine O-methyltransferase